jgi:hypothetical protein
MVIRQSSVLMCDIIIGLLNRGDRRLHVSYNHCSVEIVFLVIFHVNVTDESHQFAATTREVTFVMCRAFVYVTIVQFDLRAR